MIEVDNVREENVKMENVNNNKINKIFMKNKLIIFLIATMILLPNISLAVGLGDATINLNKAGDLAGTANYNDLSKIIGVGINTALAFVGLIFMVLMIYAGYLWMTARGEEEPVKKAKKIITASIIGLILVISAYAITNLVVARFTS